ncbi:MAG: Ribosomal RNA large subunit methyltransferase I [Verrucomicrobiae bacterium]|nr:Ribosomal RNA large subunit methyltransferase I [Verrucomicrobiae bacterium]
MFGHPWIYSGEIAKLTGEPADGDVVDIRDHKDRPHGSGLLNRKSQITVRRFTAGKEELDRTFFRKRIDAALAYRKTVLPATATSFRVVWSEADQLPGLIVDKFGDDLVFQALTLGVDKRKGTFIEILRDLFKPKSILERSDVPSRRLEGLPEEKGVVYGKYEGNAVITVGGVQFEGNLLEDQKTGFFLDQAENYASVGAHCAGKKVLDCFSYHGGFGMFAAKAGASRVEAVESSEPANVRAHNNAKLNGVEGKIEFNCANVFDVLKAYDKEKRQFDVIILDPPTFARAKQNVDDALRGYKEINLRALKMLPPGGILATFSCSHHITSSLLESVVIEAAADARKTVRLVKTLTQSADHPVLLGVPETEYLKGFLLQVV